MTTDFESKGPDLAVWPTMLSSASKPRVELRQDSTKLGVNLLLLFHKRNARVRAKRGVGLKMQCKEQLRIHFRQRRQAIEPRQREVWGKQIIARIEAWLRLQNVGLVLGYRSCHDEVNINSLVDRLSQSVPLALPVVRAKGQMDFYRYQLGDTLVQNRWGIEEPLPQASPVQPGEHSIVLVPALAIDEKGFRLGYGGGFYDRYIERYPQLTSLGVVFEEFLKPSLPVEAHDITLHYVVHQNGILKI